MIVIKDIEVLETNQEVCELIQKCEQDFSVMKKMHPEQVSFITEIIDGKQFVNPQTGKKIYLGLSKKAQDILDLPMESFDNMYQQISDLSNKNNRLQKDYDKLHDKCVNFHNMHFLKKIWFIIKKEYLI